MRSELGKITLDKTFEEREALNIAIVQSINAAADAWGLQCLRYEIKDITPPEGIVQAMELQAEAERRKRASILESEGQRQAVINVAEGDKQQVILSSEASKQAAINKANGDAQAILARSQATADGLEMLAQQLTSTGGTTAAQLRVAEQYVEAFSKLAKEGNTLLLPSSISDPASMVAQALSVFKTMQQQPQLPQGTPPGSGSSGSSSGSGSTRSGAAAAMSAAADSGSGSGSSSALGSGLSKGSGSGGSGFSSSRQLSSSAGSGSRSVGRDAGGSSSMDVASGVAAVGGAAAGAGAASGWTGNPVFSLRSVMDE
eukprot:GHUV01008114.1.p1 GENE.GHUV01008114.1~~GHUV01008114.1.p1  ORF type:complete len:315 (+),score=138.07 GHUV01008114.1:1154-2098(+)